MDPTPENPNRWLPLKLAVILLCGFAAIYAVTPKERTVTGTWASDSDSGMVILDLRPDGTYLQHDQGQEISQGRWKLDKSFLIFRNLELDDSYRLPVGLDDLQLGKGKMIYSLLHREGKLCLKAGKQAVYWCKAQ